MFILPVPQSLTSTLCYPCKEVRPDPQAGDGACVLWGTFSSVGGFFTMGRKDMDVSRLESRSEPVWDGLQGCTFAAWSVVAFPFPAPL